MAKQINLEKALLQAFIDAIKIVGLKTFKSTSMFGRNA